MLSLDVGFRLDNSAKSASDLAQLSLSDRVSLGVSDYNAVFGGAHVMIPAGKAWVGLEGSIEAFLGSPPSDRPMATLDDGKIIVRGTLTGGLHITDEWSLLAFVEVAKSPGITAAQVTASEIPIVPYEPNCHVRHRPRRPVRRPEARPSHHGKRLREDQHVRGQGGRRARGCQRPGDR